MLKKPVLKILTEVQIPNHMQSRWRGILDTITETLHVPVALIRRIHANETEVFAKSRNEGNVYQEGQTTPLNSGLYCETVVDTNGEVAVLNALKNTHWQHNPDIKYGMISYLGMPLLWPTGQLFGTICVLNKKETSFSETHRRLLGQFQQAIQSDLSALYHKYLLSREVSERKKNLKYLEERERNLAEAQKIAHLGNWVWDLKENRISWSDEIYKIFGVESREIPISYDVFLEYVHPDDREKVKLAVDEALKHLAPSSVDHRIIRPDGSERIVHEQGEVVLDATGNPVRMVGIVQDITDTRHMEQLIHQSRERYRRLVEELGDNFVVYTHLVTGRFLYVSPGVKALFGVTPEQALGLDWYHLADWTQETVAKGEHVVRQLTSTGELERIEMTYRVADGSYRSLLVSPYGVKNNKGEVVCIEGIAEDITDRKRAEQELQKHRDHLEELVEARTAALRELNESLKQEIAERQRLSMAVEQSAEVVMITDTDGVIQYVNPAFEEVTGYSPLEAIGKNASLLKSGKQDVDFYHNLWETITSGQVWEGTFENRKKSGDLYTEKAVISPIRDEAEKITNFVAVKRDITREVELETQLRHTQKMEAVGQLAGGIAHDFNNLLQAICGFTELAKADLPPDDPVQDGLEQIQKASDLAISLVRQLLIFSRRDTILMQPVDMNDLVVHLLKMIKRLIGENIEVELREDSGIGTINADPGQVEQILLNLCINARDAMPLGGRILIETQNAELDSKYCSMHADATEGRFVALAVTDTGTGIPPDILQRIFEPFFTTKETGKGTGLGLATVYAIVKRHKGFLDVQSEEGHGSTFTIFLPVIEHADQDRDKQKDLKEKDFQGSGETILLAEDENHVRNMVTSILIRSGYKVLPASDGQKAIDIFEQHQHDIDLALLDLIMPKKSGRMVYEQIKSIRPDIPVIFASAYGFSVLEKDQLPADEYLLLHKPFHNEDLLSKIHVCLSSDRGA